MQLSSNHWMGNLEFLSRFSNNSVRFLWHAEGVVSYGRLQTSILFQKQINHLNIYKNIGLNTDPCGTPHNKLKVYELKVLLVLTPCILLFKSLKLNLSVSLLNPQTLSFATKS